MALGPPLITEPAFARAVPAFDGVKIRAMKQALDLPRIKPMIYEVRDYHIRPDSLEIYRAWAQTHARPYLLTVLDVAGFWINVSEAPEISGVSRDVLGPSNVTWVIRWNDMAQRDAEFLRIFSSPSWLEIFAMLPGGGDNYLRIQAKFAEALA